MPLLTAYVLQRRLFRIQPITDAFSDQVGSVLLDEVSGAGNRYDRQFLLHPIPAVVKGLFYHIFFKYLN